MKDIILYGPRGHEIVFKAKNTDPKFDRMMRYLETQRRSTGFKSGETTRLNFNWRASIRDINVMLQQQHREMRAKSRWLAINNPYAAGAVNTFLNFCVGTGFELQMAARKVTMDEDDEPIVEDRTAYNEQVEEVFEEWSESVTPNAPIGAPEEFYETQPTMFRRWLVDGEVFIEHHVHTAQEVVPFAYRCIDADFIDTERTEFKGNPIVMGVELDRLTWQPVAYWVYTRDNIDVRFPNKINSRRILAKNMVHLFNKHFPHQVRGLPFSSVVGEKFFQTDEYTNAQLIRNKIAAMFAMFIEGQDGGGVFNSNVTITDEENTEEGFPIDADGNLITNLAPGIIGKVPPGFKVHEVSPSSPEQQYKAFLVSNLEALGTGYEGGLSYSGLTRDTSRTTFAGGRQQENYDFQGFRPIMKKFSRKALTAGVFRPWFNIAELSGAISPPTVDFLVNPRKWMRHFWMPAGWDRGINPLQQVNASEKSMANYITTLDDEAAFLGKDAKTNIMKAARLERQKQKAGLPNLLDGSQKALDQQVDPAVEAEMVAAAIQNQADLEPIRG